MERITLEQEAVEESTYVISMGFTDASGLPVAPDDVTWTLSDLDGNIINNRDQVVAPPATSMSVVLSGDDLALKPDEINIGWRVFTVLATYSSTEGNNLPLNEEYAFKLRPLIVVPQA